MSSYIILEKQTSDLFSNFVLKNIPQCIIIRNFWLLISEFSPTSSFIRTQIKACLTGLKPGTHLYRNITFIKLTLWTLEEKGQVYYSRVEKTYCFLAHGPWPKKKNRQRVPWAYVLIFLELLTKAITIAGLFLNKGVPVLHICVKLP